MGHREEWLKETNRLLEEDEFSILNIKLLYEDENIIMYQGQFQVAVPKELRSVLHTLEMEDLGGS